MNLQNKYQNLHEIGYYCNWNQLTVSTQIYNKLKN